MSANRTVTTRRSSPTTASCDSTGRTEARRAVVDRTAGRTGHLRSIRVAHGDPSYGSRTRRRTGPTTAGADLARVGRPPASTPQEPAHECDACQRAGTAAARAVDAVKYYGYGDTAVAALAGVTVDFAHGQLTAIMGPSGSGKSTLMHCMAGLDTLTSGQVFIGDVDLRTLDDKGLTRLRRDRLGFIFQAYNLIPTLTALENITLPGALAGREPDQAVARPRGRHRRPRRPPHPPAERALRRPAAARRRGPRARPAARDHLRRRADRQPRLAGQRRDPRVHADRGAAISARPS